MDLKYTLSDITLKKFQEKIENNLDLKLESKVVSTLFSLFVEGIVQELENGNTVKIKNFGTFELKFLPEHERYSYFHEGNKLKVPNRVVSTFTNSKSLRDTLTEKAVTHFLPS